MLEGSRLACSVILSRSVASDQTINDYIPRKLASEAAKTKTLTAKAGARVLVDLTTASRDPAAFPDAEEVKLDRPLESYVHYGWASHPCLGKDSSQIMMTSIFKAVVRLKNLERVSGPRGELKSFPALTWNGQVGQAGESHWSGSKVYMTPDQSSYSAVPTTMRVKYQL